MDQADPGGRGDAAVSRSVLGQDQGGGGGGVVDEPAVAGDTGDTALAMAPPPPRPLPATEPAWPLQRRSSASLDPSASSTTTSTSSSHIFSSATNSSFAPPPLPDTTTLTSPWPPQPALGIPGPTSALLTSPTSSPSPGCNWPPFTPGGSIAIGHLSQPPPRLADAATDDSATASATMMRIEYASATSSDSSAQSSSSSPSIWAPPSSFNSGGSRSSTMRSSYDTTGVQALEAAFLPQSTVARRQASEAQRSSTSARLSPVPPYQHAMRVCTSWPIGDLSQTMQSSSAAMPPAPPPVAPLNRYSAISLSQPNVLSSTHLQTTSRYHHDVGAGANMGSYRAHQGAGHGLDYVISSDLHERQRRMSEPLAPQTAPVTPEINYATWLALRQPGKSYSDPSSSTIERGPWSVASAWPLDLRDGSAAAAAAGLMAAAGQPLLPLPSLSHTTAVQSRSGGPFLSTPPLPQSVHLPGLPHLGPIGAEDPAEMAIPRPDRSPVMRRRPSAPVLPFRGTGGAQEEHYKFPAVARVPSRSFQSGQSMPHGPPTGAAASGMPEWWNSDSGSYYSSATGSSSGLSSRTLSTPIQGSGQSSGGGGSQGLSGQPSFSSLEPQAVGSFRRSALSADDLYKLEGPSNSNQAAITAADAYHPFSMAPLPPSRHSLLQQQHSGYPPTSTRRPTDPGWMSSDPTAALLSSHPRSASDGNVQFIARRPSFSHSDRSSAAGAPHTLAIASLSLTSRHPEYLAPPPYWSSTQRGSQHTSEPETPDTTPGPSPGAASRPSSRTSSSSGSRHSASSTAVTVASFALSEGTTPLKLSSRQAGLRSRNRSRGRKKGSKQTEATEQSSAPTATPTATAAVAAGTVRPPSPINPASALIASSTTTASSSTVTRPANRQLEAFYMQKLQPFQTGTNSGWPSSASIPSTTSTREMQPSGATNSGSVPRGGGSTHASASGNMFSTPSGSDTFWPVMAGSVIGADMGEAFGDEDADEYSEEDASGPEDDMPPHD